MKMVRNEQIYLMIDANNSETVADLRNEDVSEEVTAKTQDITLEADRRIKDNIASLVKNDFSFLCITGPYGLGKSYLVRKYLKELLADNNKFVFLDGHSTAKAVFESLSLHRDKEVIVFDDKSAIFNDEVIEILKPALCNVEGKQRTITWDVSKVPSSFDFNSRIILIYNDDIKPPKTFNALRKSRGFEIKYELSVTEIKSKLKAMYEETKQYTGKNLHDTVDKDVLDYVMEHCNEATEDLNIRTVLLLSNKRRSGTDWETEARIFFKVNPHKQLLINMLDSAPPGKKIMDIQREWCDATGMSERTFENYKAYLDKQRKKSSKLYDDIRRKNCDEYMLKKIESDVDDGCKI